MKFSLSFLFKAFLGHINHGNASLPYNLNWGVNKRRLRDFLSKYPLFVVDIGARGSPMKELADLSKFIRYAGFDADQEECNRLMSDPPRDYLEYRVHPYFIGQSGIVDLHLYEGGGWSSIYRVSHEFNRAFGAPRLERTVSLSAVPLDDAMIRAHVAAPDLLKLDTQGSELDILRGASRTLAETSLVEVETEFFPMYEGQPLFSDVDALLRASGFQLLYLNRFFHQRRKFYRGLSRGQLIYGDALYGKGPSRLDGLSPERVAKYIILLCNYGHLDIAYQICEEHPEVRELCPDISCCFPKPPSMVRRGLISQLDKLTCLLLHMRRTNHVTADSDRSWPIR